MPKRTPLKDKMNDNEKMSKAIGAFTTSKPDKIKSVDQSDKDALENNNNENTNSDNDVNNDVNKITNEIIIKSSKKVTPKRATYYLLPETIKKINKMAKEAGIGKSELVQTLLEEAMNRAKIER